MHAKPELRRAFASHIIPFTRPRYLGRYSTTMDQIQQLIDDLKFSDPARREAAAHALHDLGDGARLAVPALFDAILREPDACPWVGTAFTRLGHLAPDIDALASALHSENSHVRFWAARTAVKLGPVAEPLIPDLISLLCDTHQPVTDSVVWALGSIGHAAITPLITAARADDAQLRARAVLTLGRYHENAALKLPQIIKSLDDADPTVRKHAAHAVCSLGQFAHPDRSVYDTDTFALLLGALDRIADDSTIDVDAEWFDRICGWLGPSA